MKKLFKIVSAVAILSGTMTAFAQDNQPLTRAQVYAEMVQYKNAGFNPARQNPRSWVDDARNASSTVAAEKTPGTAHLANDHEAGASCDSHL